MLRSKLTLGGALIGASFLAGCAYGPGPGPYAYNPGYYSPDPAYYSYGYDPAYYDNGYGYGYGYGSGYGAAFYGYYDAGHHWHSRGDRDWNRADWQRYHGNEHSTVNRTNVNAQPRENFSHSTAQAPRDTMQRTAPHAPTQLGNRAAPPPGGNRNGNDNRDNH